MRTSGLWGEEFGTDDYYKLSILMCLYAYKHIVHFLAITLVMPLDDVVLHIRSKCATESRLSII